jgi:hypothetical protein
MYVSGLREAYIPEAYPSQIEDDMKKTKIGLYSAAVGLLFALAAVTSVMAYTGSIACLTPASCATSDTISLSGPGSSTVATLWLYASTAPSGATIYYFVCPSTSSTCSSPSGTSNGWSWSFTPTSGTTGTGSPCAAGSSCEGNGVGSPSTLSLSVTAPTTVTATNQQIELEVYACSLTGTSYTCDSLFQGVASLTITATVPQFALGLGLAITIGLVGLVLVKKRTTPKLASTAGITAAA